MEQLEATDFASLHAIFSTLRLDSMNWMFRGHSDVTWKLLPKAGRSPFHLIEDRPVFESWKRRAIEYVKILPGSDWDWLAIAQHHGLATRLLDWTKNPLNAAYFAVRENQKADAVIYAARFRWRIITEQIHPMDVKEVAVFFPSGVVPRITRQAGLFTIHGNPTVALEDSTGHVEELLKIIIPEENRDGLLRELSYYGVNASTLFPDLDGLSAFLNWTIESQEYWKVRSAEDDLIPQKSATDTSVLPKGFTGNARPTHMG